MKSDIADLYDQITGEENGLERLLSRLPGLSGYMERGRRRDADQLLRQTITGRLEEVRLNLGRHQEALSRDIVTAVFYAEPLGRADTGLRGLTGKIKDAPQGYAGFFAAVKVDEDDLAHIYAFDETMLIHVDTIDAAVTAVGEAIGENGDIEAAIRDLENAIQEANQVFNRRNEVLAGIS